MKRTDFKDYYGILGVSRTALGSEIKKNFRKLALKYHPDRNPGDKKAEARFKEISEAYDVLSDEEKRKKYDQFGKYWQQKSQRGPTPTGASANVDFNNFDFSQYSNFDEFINELFGRSSNPFSSSTQSSSYRNGTQRQSVYNNFRDFGSNPGSKTNTDAEKQIRLTFADAYGGMQQRLRIGNETIKVRIPPGAKQGTKIRLRGKGNLDPYTRQRGDLYLKVQLISHSFYQFDGDNLVCEVPISPEEAVLGASIEVPTPGGKVTMTIPPGIRSGQTLRLRGKGWPNPKGEPSDQLVKIIIATPKKISAEERKLYEKIRASRSYDPRGEMKYEL